MPLRIKIGSDGSTASLVKHTLDHVSTLLAREGAGAGLRSLVPIEISDLGGFGQVGIVLIFLARAEGVRVPILADRLQYG